MFLTRWDEEWEERGWRDAQGWHGNDLIHNRRGKAVRVLDYYFKKQDESLVGVVHFGPDAESHRGLCHGGAMTSVMDDLLGHLSFLAEGTPWCGATVQVNVKLKKPVKVGQYLRISGRVVKREGSKVFISGKLEDENGNEYATLGEFLRWYFTIFVYILMCEPDGLSISGVKLSDIEDHVSSRTFIEVDTKLKCSGWDIDSK